MDSKLTFAELRERNISSDQLLSWSASIDLAERYQIFLNNISHLSSSENEILFYNCTMPWFGPLCRFAFDIQVIESLEEIVRHTFRRRLNITNGVKVTCYRHLNCQTSFRCLDWREICDRNVHCLDGSDEINCWQLEINECTENEYRCYNGQCVPENFLNDDFSNPDCLDRTDELPYVIHHRERCLQGPIFWCEEYTCTPQLPFSCGDGQCMPGLHTMCGNGRNNPVLENPCLRATFCLVSPLSQIGDETCLKLCTTIECIQSNCPLTYEFPTSLIIFDHVRLIFQNKDIRFDYSKPMLPDYVCYDEKLCGDFLPHTMRLNDSTCRHFHELKLPLVDHFYLTYTKDIFHKCLIVPNQTHYCNHSTLYRCENSTKCISKHRLVDGIYDCPFDDDEAFNDSCSLNDSHYRIECLIGLNKKCFSPIHRLYLKYICENAHDQVDKDVALLKYHIYFQNICDNITHLSPVVINGRNETDETECQHWPCNNTYTHCNGFWSCKDGADEINCPTSTCPKLEHMCVFPNDTSKISCLPIARAGDGIVDCLGGSDEKQPCQSVDGMYLRQKFQCRNNVECLYDSDLCNTLPDCPLGDDEKFCLNPPAGFSTCNSDLFSLTEAENFLCNLAKLMPSAVLYFTLRDIPTYSVSSATDTIVLARSVQTKSRSIQSNPIVRNRHDDEWRCNRGLTIYIPMKNGTYGLHCLCSPSYYGDTCQYQNQRVSLTVQIQPTSEWRSVFTFITTLVDDQGNIESHDHIDYLSVRDCERKFNIYLLYSTRPKNVSKMYSVKIDVFNKLTLNYRASWIYPLQFIFLPVHRLSVLLTVPISDAVPVRSCVLPCIHGQCFNYVNVQNLTFCRCDPGWSGTQCNIQHTCNCAPSSFCISDSICICRLGQFGLRCHLQSLCPPKSCANDGRCVPNDERHVSGNSKKFTCICSQQYFGERCEHQQTRIDILLDKKVTIPPSILIHFNTVQGKAQPFQTSIRKKIAFDQDVLSIYTSITFNIALTKMLNDYYLIILREQNIISMNISTQIIPSQRCASIHEVFNETLAKQHLLKRIKYYHIPCRERLELVCFYDNVHLCLCNPARQANCLELDYNLTDDCHTNNWCGNKGRCFQDNRACATSAFCDCDECYYGSQCQLSTRGSTLSLDTILGYQIRPNTGISGQTTIIKFTIALTIIMLVLSLINGVFSILTFQRKKIRNIGCGLYLLTSSIASVITISVLTVKFWLLFSSQNGSINNHSFVRIQCVLLDFVLRVVISIGDWLSACVAIERAVNVSKGVNFDARKSKRIAKWMILIVFLFTSCTYIHDPISRHLIDDEEEKRTWCVTEYSPPLQTFDRVLNIFHIFIPFLINGISAFVIIITAARSRATAQKKHSYKELLYEQFQHHKHLLISPCILVVLTLPRLIISFLFECMKSARNPWPYLIAYFVSFISPMLIFVVFVLPSEMYKTEFKESIKQLWHI